MNLVERLREGVADTGVLIKSAATVNATMSEAATRIEQLEAENAALREDAERLDWLLSHPDATVCNGGPYGPFHIWFRYSNRTTEEKQTAREAIDAARGKS